MTWQITLFNWTGFLLFETLMWATLIYVAYNIWDKVLYSLPFCWRVGIMTSIMTDKNSGWKDGKKFKDNNGKIYKIVEVKQ